MTGIWLVSYLALWLLFLLITFVLISVLHNLGVIYRSLEERGSGLTPPPTNLKAGEYLPPITVYELSGERLSLSDFYGTKIAFSVVAPGCSACIQFLQKISNGSVKPDPLDPNVNKRIIVCIGSFTDAKSLLEASDCDRNGLKMVVDTEHEVVAKWGLSLTPATVVADDTGKIIRQVFSSG